jgi:hypothetical protein
MFFVMYATLPHHTMAAVLLFSIWHEAHAVGSHGFLIVCNGNIVVLSFQFTQNFLIEEMQ